MNSNVINLDDYRRKAPAPVVLANDLAGKLTALATRIDAVSKKLEALCK